MDSMRDFDPCGMTVENTVVSECSATAVEMHSICTQISTVGRLMTEEINETGGRGPDYPADIPRDAWTSRFLRTPECSTL